MLEGFFLRAILAGIGVALIAGPLGCFVVWRRMAYFGDTMAHSALLGIALALLIGLNLTAGVFAMAALVAMALFVLRRRQPLSSDALLGILSHSTLALGLVLLAFMTQVRIDLLALLFGDILSVSRLDLVLIYGGGAVVLVILAAIWRALLAGTVSADIAQAEGLEPERAEIVFMLLMALAIALAMKVVGVLLITSLLIIPAAAAREHSATPEGMAVRASLLGVAAVVAGLYGSLAWDTPSGPSIVVAALLLFLAGLALSFVRRRRT
jgi:zinc transport system permease protein